MIRLSKLPFILLIRGYQLFVSPLFVGHCRYHPTCSQYAANAIEVHGIIKGSWLTIKRLAKCQPWGGWGFDLVPPASGSDQQQRRHSKEKCIAHNPDQRYIRSTINVFHFGK